jgi:CubicO group peptidase (beta-lactamase class C family)
MKNRIHRAAAVVVGGALGVAAWSGAAVSPTSAAGIDRYLRAQNFTGSALVARDGRVVLARGYGYADLERRTPNTARTEYRVTWLASQFTDVAVLQLVDDGKLKLGDSICVAVPACPAAWRRVTVRDLETYRVGLALPTRRPAASASLLRWIGAMKGEKPVWSPFANHRGSDLVLQRIVEARSRMSWWRYVSANILRRAGMSRTHYDSAGADTRRATPYDGARALRIRDARATPDRSDGIVSTVLDFYRYSRAIDDGKLLSAAGRAELTELVPGSFLKGAYGVWRYGWLVSRSFGHLFEGQHAHGEPGWSSTFFRLPEERITIVLFQNRTNGSGNIPDELERVLLGCPPGSIPTPKPC